jgi:hypothetical protein
VSEPTEQRRRGRTGDFGALAPVAGIIVALCHVICSMKLA